MLRYPEYADPGGSLKNIDMKRVNFSDKKVNPN